MITRERIEQILKESGVLMEGHFLLTSGRHSNKYMQCARIFRHPKYSEELCAALAEQFSDEKIDVVIGPAMGAVQMAYEVSRAAGCENFFTERDEEGKMTLRRGFVITPGMRCLLVEDVVTTGGSVRSPKAGGSCWRRCSRHWLSGGPQQWESRFWRAFPVCLPGRSRFLGCSRMSVMQRGCRTACKTWQPETNMKGISYGRRKDRKKGRKTTKEKRFSNS